MRKIRTIVIGALCMSVMFGSAALALTIEPKLLEQDVEENVDYVTIVPEESGEKIVDQRISAKKSRGATTGVDDVSGVDVSSYPTIEEQLIENEILSEERQFDAKQKLLWDSDELDALANEVSAGTRLGRAAWNQLSGSYTLYGQSNNRYCAVACVQAAIKYCSGNYYSQDTLAESVGSKGDHISMRTARGLVNYYQTKNNYVLVENDTEKNMATRIYLDVASYGAPTILAASCAEDAGWACDSNAYAVTIYTIDSDRNNVMIADPIFGVKSNAKKFYSLSIGQVHRSELGYLW